MFLTSLLIDEDQDLMIIRKQFLDDQVVMVNASVFCESVVWRSAARYFEETWYFEF